MIKDMPAGSLTVEDDPQEVVSTPDAVEQHGKVTTSYTIFLIVVAIVFLAIAVVFAINTYFYDKIRKNGCASSISKSEAEALYWTNLVLAIVAGIMFIVSIILIFTETKAPSYATKYLGRLKYQTESGEVIGLGEAGRRAAAAGYARGAGLARAGYARGAGLARAGYARGVAAAQEVARRGAGGVVGGGRGVFTGVRDPTVVGL